MEEPTLESFAHLINHHAHLFATPHPTQTPISLAALALIKNLFNNALKQEAWQRPIYNETLACLADEKPVTRAQRARRLKQGLRWEKHESTPLIELFGDSDEMVWQQLELRHVLLDKLAKKVLGHADASEDSMALNGLGTASEDAVHAQLALDEEGSLDEEVDLDDSSFRDEGEEESVMSLESEFSDDPAANDSFQPLNSDSPSSKLTIKLSRAALAASKKAILSNGKGKAGPRSAVDDDFFSLSDFQQMSERGEREMERFMAGGRQNKEDQDLDEGIDMFEPQSSWPRDTLMNDIGEEQEAEDEDMDEGLQDLQDVADVTYDTFFAPPSTSKLPDTPSHDLEEGNSSRRSLVRFSNDVKVRSMPARKKRFSAARLDEQLRAFAKEMGVRPEDLRIEEADVNDDSDEEGEEEEETEGMEIDGQDSARSEEQHSSDEDNGEAAITRLKSDLFEDADEDEEPDAAGLSKHEKRQRTLAAEIETLEQENVGRKDWTLSGEARARDRPLNSLLEQDLEFEHVGKLVPTITTESTQSLEEKIKARILADQWDDVQLKLVFDPKAFLPSQLLDISATQSGKSLAELYEDEYSADRQRAEGRDVLDERDSKLKARHAELEKIFEGICAKLDALSNAHFTPKAPKTQIATISNTSTIAMESALPATTSNATLLAPEEIYKAPSKATGADRSDLTSAHKKSLRQKERKQKQRLSTKTKVLAGKARVSPSEEKEIARQKLIGTRGVTVIGKPGRESQDNSKTKSRDAKAFKL